MMWSSSFICLIEGEWVPKVTLCTEVIVYLNLHRNRELSDFFFNVWPDSGPAFFNMWKGMAYSLVLYKLMDIYNERM